VGLVWGLAVGLVWGLAVGLVWGLVWGLAVLLINFKEAFPFSVNIYPILFLVSGVIILAEILFWLMPKEKIKKGRFWYTCKRKIENIFEVLLGLSAIGQIYVLGREIGIRFTKEAFEVFMRWAGYIGLGIIVLGLVAGIFYLWIKLNSIKYRR
jgi:hypothetical protein